jgi:hypothetical protein
MAPLFIAAMVASAIGSGISAKAKYDMGKQQEKMYRLNEDILRNKAKTKEGELRSTLERNFYRRKAVVGKVNAQLGRAGIVSSASSLMLEADTEKWFKIQDADILRSSRIEQKNLLTRASMQGTYGDMTRYSTRMGLASDVFKMGSNAMMQTQQQ